MDRVRVVIRGRVQGVGFRHFVLLHARAAGLMGWVRNLEGGDVEVEAEGSRPALESLLAELRLGPAGARVQDLTASWSEGPPRHLDFQVTRG